MDICWWRDEHQAPRNNSKLKTRARGGPVPQNNEVMAGKNGDLAVMRYLERQLKDQRETTSASNVMVRNE
jgi:hypothetical protein